METTIYRKCSHCGLEALNKEDLNLFIRDKYKSKFYYTKAICKKCYSKAASINRMGPKHGPFLLGICKNCKLIPLTYKDLENLFIKDKTMKSGYANLCKECNKIRVLIHNKNNPEIVKKRSRRKLLKGLYNITNEIYDLMLEKQNYSCGICKTNIDKLNKRLFIDHDHKCCPGKNSCGKCIRGLLCHNCNFGIGNLKDDIKILQDAIIYLGGD